MQGGNELWPELRYRAITDTVSLANSNRSALTCRTAADGKWVMTDISQPHRYVDWLGDASNVLRAIVRSIELSGVQAARLLFKQKNERVPRGEWIHSLAVILF